MLRELEVVEKNLRKFAQKTIEVVKPCEQCGTCCDADVHVTVFEAARILDYTGKDFDELFDVQDILISLKKVNGRCVLYDPKSRKCLAHEVKPLQCLTYPVPLVPVREGDTFACRSGKAVYRAKKFEKLLASRRKFLEAYYVTIVLETAKGTSLKDVVLALGKKRPP